jgi:hypothetical protein
MAVGHLTYKDLTPEQRREGAKAQREQLRQLMANPFLASEQLQALSERLAHIDKWEMGHLEVGKKPGQQPALPASEAAPSLPSPKTPAALPAAREPVHHTIEVVDTVSIEEQVSGDPPKKA